MTGLGDVAVLLTPAENSWTRPLDCTTDAAVEPEQEPASFTALLRKITGDSWQIVSITFWVPAFTVAISTNNGRGFHVHTQGDWGSHALCTLQGLVVRLF
jgi:hypothetical protein